MVFVVKATNPADTKKASFAVQLWSGVNVYCAGSIAHANAFVATAGTYADSTADIA